MSKEKDREKYERKALKVEIAEVGVDIRIARLLERSIVLEEATVGLLGEAVTLLKRIDYILTPKQLTKSVAAVFSQPTQGASSPMPAQVSNNSLEFLVGQTSTLTPTPFLADGVTNSGGTVSAVSYTFSDPSATVVLNADGVTALCTAVAPSTAGPVSGSFSATVTDTDGVVSTWNQAFTVLVDPAAPPPQQLTQSVAAVFSTPQ